MTRALAPLLLCAGFSLADEPTLIKDIVPGPTSSSPYNFTALGNRLLFWTLRYDASAYPYGYDYDLWSSDGTESGTVMLVDYPAGSYFYSQQVRLPGNRLVFWTYRYNYSTYAYETEIWGTDGTPAGTALLSGLDGYASVSNMVLENSVLFYSYRPAGGYDLWVTDGTAAGTSLLKANIGTITSPYKVGNRWLFWAYRYDASTSPYSYDYDLWSTDGTAAGTILLEDFGASYGNPTSITRMGDALLFWARNATGGYALWRTDGTDSGTFRLKDADAAGTGGTPYAARLLGSVLLFWSSTSSSTYTLWRTDGTEAGTYRLGDTLLSTNTYYPSVPDALGDGLVYRIYNYTAGGYALWRTDGTQGGTYLLKVTGSSTAAVRMRDLLYFTVYSSPSGYSLWRTDGTTAGTLQLASGNFPVIYSSNTAALGDLLLFYGSGSGGFTLWRSDGTAAGTLPLKSVGALTYQYLYSPTVLGNVLLFWTYNSTNGFLLWRTDGTSAGTYLLKDTDPTGVGGNPYSVTLVGNRVVFSTYRYDSTTWRYEYQLWSTDGTEGGTLLLGTNPLYGSLIAFGSALLFWSSTPADGYSLWRTDGTPGGTYMLADTDPAGIDGAPSGFQMLTNGALFSAHTTGGYMLWRTDGTAAGTVVLSPVPSTYPHSYYSRFVGSNYILWIPDGAGGYDLWRSDGSADGTTLLADIGTSTPWYFPSSYDSYYHYLSGGTLVFSAYATVGAYSLWQTDGSASGTRMLKAGFSYMPSYFTPVGDVVFFAGAEPATGQELWRLSGGSAPAQAAEVPVPPAFTKPTNPANGSSFTWVAGKKLSLELSAFDSNARDVVTLSGRNLPSGAVLSPALPAQGNPVSASFAWTPGAGDAGERVLEFVAGDGTHETSYRITVTVTVDSDGDGLLDLWETPAPDGDGGYTHDGVFVDLVGMGANPRRKDIFVEIDYMADATRSQRPRQSAIDKIVAMFANAPVSNPDGSTGISLHVRVDSAVPWSDLLGSTGISGYDWTAFDSIKERNFDSALRMSTHYCLFAYKLPNGISGLSRGNGAADFIVALGGLPATFNQEWAEAGTFGHELGHNLGLMHGGNDDVRQKPNYMSIMNLPFQLRGLRRFGADGYFDYSREALPDLDERNLDETRPITPLLSGLQTTYWASRQYWTAALPGSIDWDANGSLSAGIAADLNRDYMPTVLRGWNDWANLNFTGGSLGAGIVLPEPETTPAEQEMDEQEAQEVKPAAPVGLSVRAGTGSMRVVWNSCGEGLAYNVYRWVGSASPAKIGSTDRALYTDTTVTKGITYNYAVTVINGPESELSASASATAR